MKGEEEREKERSSIKEKGKVGTRGGTDDDDAKGPRFEGVVRFCDRISH